MSAPPPLHVLMTTDAVGGVWVHAVTLARGLCRHGDHVTLVIMGPRPRVDQLAELRKVPGLDIEITDLTLEWMDLEGADRARTAEMLAAIERRVRPDVVHLNSYREAAGEWCAPVLVGAHSCVASWWRACRPGVPLAPQWLPYVEQVQEGLAAADAWAAPTAAFRDELQHLYAPPSRGLAIWNGLVPEQPASCKEPLILAAGRIWDEAKNIAALDAIAARLDWPVWIAGPHVASPEDGDPTPPQYDTRAEARLLGDLPRGELLALMQRAAIFVAPAVYEPFGLTVLEAASAGCALVLADIPSFRELWQGAALFVPPNDRNALFDALQQMSRNEMARRTLQQRAVLRAGRYSASDMVKGYRRAYHALPRAASPHAETSRHHSAEAIS